MNARKWSPNNPWSRRQWLVLRWVLVAEAAAGVALAAASGIAWLGVATVVIVAAAVRANFYGERLEHGPRDRGGEP